MQLKEAKLLSDDIDKILRTEITKKYKTRPQQIFSLYAKYKQIKEQIISKSKMKLQKSISDSAIFIPSLSTSLFPKSTPLKSKFTKSIYKSTPRPQPTLPFLVLNNQLSIGSLSSTTYRQNELKVNSLFSNYENIKKTIGLYTNKQTNRDMDSDREKGKDKNQPVKSKNYKYNIDKWKRNQIVNSDSLNILNKLSSYLSFKERRQQEQIQSPTKKIIIHDKSLDDLLDKIRRIIDFHNDKNNFLYQKGVRNLIEKEIAKASPDIKKFITETSNKLRKKLKATEVSSNSILEIKQNLSSINLKNEMEKEAHLVELGYNDSDNDSISHCLSSDIRHLANKQHINNNKRHNLANKFNTIIIQENKPIEEASSYETFQDNNNQNDNQCNHTVETNDNAIKPFEKERKTIKITQRFRNINNCNCNYHCHCKNNSNEGNPNGGERLFDMEKYKRESIRNVLRENLNKRAVFKRGDFLNKGLTTRPINHFFDIKDSSKQINDTKDKDRNNAKESSFNKVSALILKLNITNPDENELNNWKVKLGLHLHNEESPTENEVDSIDFPNTNPHLNNNQKEKDAKMLNDDIISIKKDIKQPTKTTPVQNLLVNLSKVPQLNLNRPSSPERILNQEHNKDRMECHPKIHRKNIKKTHTGVQVIAHHFLIGMQEKAKHISKSRSYESYSYLTLDKSEEIDYNQIKIQQEQIKSYVPMNNKCLSRLGGTQNKAKFNYIPYKTVGSSFLNVKSHSMNNEQQYIQVLPNEQRSKRMKLANSKKMMIKKIEMPSNMGNATSILDQDQHQDQDVSFVLKKGSVFNIVKEKASTIDFGEKFELLKKHSYDTLNQKIQMDCLALSESVQDTRKRELRLNEFINNLNRDLDRYKIIQDYKAKKAIPKDKKVIFKSSSVLSI